MLLYDDTEIFMDIKRMDIRENDLYRLDQELLSILLKDRTTKRNILWATDHYAHRGVGYQSDDPMTVAAITGYHGSVIKPRAAKSKREQTDRIRKKAEVFTPSWICNKQNNLIDDAWFGAESVFNVENGNSWVATTAPIVFPTASKKTWQQYVEDVRLEITCGEAPYLASRYDTVSGDKIALEQRIGLLDRKLRVVGEQTDEETEWVRWATTAMQCVYGYDWQGDNVLLARENLLFTFSDYYNAKFQKEPDLPLLREIATIVSWNIWQMDGLKCVVPDSCQTGKNVQTMLFEETDTTLCEGCRKHDVHRHNGVYCRIKDWKTNKTLPFVSLLRGEE